MDLDPDICFEVKRSDILSMTLSEGDQITENDGSVLHSDNDIFDEQSDFGEDTFFNADYVFADQSDVEDDSFLNAGTSTSDIRHQ
ncbi:hypothetical protein J6590_061295 [Homalodisca vitripennis]|nr:hypothetical protein J6590_061295 [Homalodisca vitripennis]